MVDHPSSRYRRSRRIKLSKSLSRVVVPEAVNGSIEDGTGNEVSASRVYEFFVRTDYCLGVGEGHVSHQRFLDHFGREGEERR